MTAKPTPQVRDERLLITDYDQMARVVHLYLKEWCDESLPYPAMCADAVRKTKASYDQLKAENQSLREVIDKLKQQHTHWINGARADIIYENMEKIFAEVEQMLKKIGGTNEK